MNQNHSITSVMKAAGRRLPTLAAITTITFSIAAGATFAQHSQETQSPPETPKEVQKYAFEWGGVYALPAGVTELVIQPGPDASIDVALVPVADNSDAAFDAAIAEAVRVFTGEPKAVQPGEELTPGSQFYQLRVEQDAEMRFQVRSATSGRAALFTQHFADEFQTTFMAGGRKIFGSPVGLVEARRRAARSRMA